MRRAPWLAPTLLALLLASVPAASLLDAGTTPSIQDEQPTWPASFTDALAWSTVNKHELIAPLVPGAATLGYAPDAIQAYEEGKAWARERLASVSQADLEPALVDVLTRLDAPTGPLKTDAIPGAYKGPLTVLLEAQTSPVRGEEILPSLQVDPVGFNRAVTLNGAWVLGAIAEIEPRFDALNEEDLLGEEPVYVDPLGFVILGGTGDNTYEPVTGNPENNAPAFLLEPGGDDTYHLKVAAGGEQRIEPPAGPGVSASDFVPVLPIAIEEAGNDTYTKQSAHDAGILDEQAGNDTYGSLDRGGAITQADLGGTVFLNDREGNDTYLVRHRGIAYAGAGSTVVHADHQGNDVYRANKHDSDAFTHAAGENIGALAVLRDYEGDDTYRASGLAFASSEDDASTLFIDDQGTDDYWTRIYVGGSWGEKYISEGGFWAPTTRSPAYFIDGNGQDAYRTHPDTRSLNPDTVGNNTEHLRTSPDRRYSIFIDCETPADADYPCPEEQEEMFTTILERR